jgi:hypothetical protein
MKSPFIMSAGGAAAGLSIGLLSAFLTGLAWGQTGPLAELNGKSIIVAWPEHRVSRFVGEQNFQEHTNAVRLAVYISTTGRAFTRHTVTSASGTGSNENVGSSGGHNVEFQGKSIVVSFGLGRVAGGAKRVQLNFGGNFGTCSAAVIVGKSEGAGTFIERGLASHRQIEVQSSVAGPATCTVTQGNVFAS